MSKQPGNPSFQDKSTNKHAFKPIKGRPMALLSVRIEENDFVELKKIEDWTPLLRAAIKEIIAKYSKKK